MSVCPSVVTDKIGSHRTDCSEFCYWEFCENLSTYVTSFKIHKFYVLPTQCIYVFCVDLRTNSDYFPIQH